MFRLRHSSLYWLANVTFHAQHPETLKTQYKPNLLQFRRQYRYRNFALKENTTPCLTSSDDRLERGVAKLISSTFGEAKMPPHLYAISSIVLDVAGCQPYVNQVTYEI